jgi:hypothetical protein
VDCREPGSGVVAALCICLCSVQCAAVKNPGVLGVAEDVHNLLRYCYRSGVSGLHLLIVLTGCGA